MQKNTLSLVFSTGSCICAQIMQTLNRYERAARMRSKKRDADFDQGFFKVNAVLASVDLLGKSTPLSDVQHRKHGFCIQFRY